MNCPKCKKPYESVSILRGFDKDGKVIATHDVYEHASRIENGCRVVSSSDCCYVRRTRRALDGAKAPAKSKRSTGSPRK